MDKRLSLLTSTREQRTAQREQLLTERNAILSTVADEVREDLTEDEDTQFRELTDQLRSIDADLCTIDERIAEITDEIDRTRRVEEGTRALRRAQETHVRVGGEPATYTRGNGHSYIQDLVRFSFRLDADGAAETRLRRHGEEVARSPEYRDLDRTDGHGGFFVPPVWLMNQFLDLARAGRAVANLALTDVLPPGTDSLNIPTVASGTSTDIQAADNTQVSDTDLADTYVSAPVRTIAGQQDIAVQLLDQSPITFDQIIFSDLIADYATKLDMQTISGSGTAGQVLGIRHTQGIQTITATPTVQGVYGAIERIHTTRFQPPTVIAMHPRRWAVPVPARRAHAPSCCAATELASQRAGNPRRGRGRAGGRVVARAAGGRRPEPAHQPRGEDRRGRHPRLARERSALVRVRDPDTGVPVPAVGDADDAVAGVQVHRVHRGPVSAVDRRYRRTHHTRLHPLESLPVHRWVWWAAHGGR
ncbi:phage major capsid protein [Nocardia terpenica]|uniref:phage major capsid protein n=1 Tax=Nocardia terpenica TaxID=455432 RepID=UPI00031C9301|nr:phage major capsid protein [Nocardia terpenica]NQE88514.1 phage major capsid protein [Nocardia terpenica]